MTSDSGSKSFWQVHHKLVLHSVWVTESLRQNLSLSFTRFAAQLSAPYLCSLPKLLLCFLPCAACLPAWSDAFHSAPCPFCYCASCAFPNLLCDTHTGFPCHFWHSCHTLATNDMSALSLCKAQEHHWEACLTYLFPLPRDTNPHKRSNVPILSGPKLMPRVAQLSAVVCSLLVCSDFCVMTVYKVFCIYILQQVVM